MNSARKTAGRRARLGRRRPDLVGGEVERDRGREAEHDQQDDEPDAQQVVAELLGGDDPPAGVGHAASDAVALGGLASARPAASTGRAVALMLGPPSAARSGRSTSVSLRRLDGGRSTRGAVDVVERRHDGPERGQPQAVLDRGDEDVLADAAFGDRPGGRGPATCRLPVGRRLDRLDRRRCPRSVVARPLDVGRRRQLEPDLDDGRRRRRTGRPARRRCPDPMSRPAAKIPIRSHTDWTWVSRWLESMIASPRSSTSLRSRSRISTTPIGSIEVVGSSRISRSGDLTSASAMPSRWRMPRE